MLSPRVIERTTPSSHGITSGRLGHLFSVGEWIFQYVVCDISSIVGFIAPSWIIRHGLQLADSFLNEGRTKTSRFIRVYASSMVAQEGSASRP